jgi:hypothetical protein
MNNEQPQPLAKPTLTQGILNIWDWPQIVQMCDLSTGLTTPIAAWEFQVHDLASLKVCS